ncbi:uncharacterized protein LOC123311146 [Coccinella septempunctata]|uniref:uncharacterized protein LOC123311146 n=1 Tax=Coccinella septempunctata TaxID=41139 RepID=UPI001D06AF2F|nr:uncharacterized protein LOC123311146 [Coccinella septempunctata]
MTQISVEKRLSVIYGLAVATGLVVTISVSIAWTHWKSTLDQCVYKNCSCILFGKHTPDIFLGGPEASCIFVTYGPILSILFSVSFLCFHGYRYLFMKERPNARSVMRKTGDGETIHMAVQSDDSNPLPKAFWVTVSSMSIIFLIYSVVHFIIFLSGYYRTCKEYRKTLENELGLRGSALPVIHMRLSCGGIFDFMDYLHPIPENSYRYGFIDTGLTLMIGITTSFLSVILFTAASYFNVKRARLNY